mgnify:CR=1 FL=1
MWAANGVMMSAFGTTARLLRLSPSLANVQARALSHATTCGYARLAFNVGAGDHIALRARVFDTPTGRAFLQSCPHTLDLTTYGDEVYGEWRTPLPTGTPQAKIPDGGLAYSSQGRYLCVFFGQAPAWRNAERTAPNVRPAKPRPRAHAKASIAS